MSLVKAYRMKLLMEYCRKSSVHGVLYWSDRYRPYWERFLWMVLFVVSLVMSGRMISSSWQKWSKHAIAFTLGSQAIHISQIPFPAFTICSMARFQWTRTNYTKTLAHYQMNGESPYDWEFFDDLSQVCESGFSPEYFPKIKNSKKIYNTLRYYQQDPEAMFAICNFVRSNRSCKNFYQEVFTKHGRCYTFNGLNNQQIYRETTNMFEDSSTPISNWTLAQGYENFKETYPLRVFQVMPSYGFTIRMSFNISDGDLICYPTGVGILIQFHDPSEVPLMGERYRAITVEHYGRIVIQPEMTTTAPELERYSPHERLCFFPEERYLQHFNLYNERNCRIECMTNLTLKKCGCVFFHMPHNESVSLCGKGSLSCYQSVLRELDNDVIANSGIDHRTSCDCLPECTAINYKFDLIQHKMYLWEKNHSQVDEILLWIYFQQTSFIPFQRSELYGLTEFLASCGGILGLFMGFSVLSLTELFYFFPIRYLWDRYVAQKSRSVEKPRRIVVSPRSHVKMYVKPRF